MNTFSMRTDTINIYDLKGTNFLSPIKCEDFSEAAAVCLDFHKHNQGVILSVIQKEEKTHFKLFWKMVTNQIRDSRNDMDYTVESGAYCLAMMVINKLTDYAVVKQSKKGTGFDYWLGKINSATGLQEKARLEVSGILNGTNGQINQRLKEKKRQTTKSDSMNIPAFVVVVEFGNPVIKITLK